MSTEPEATRDERNDDDERPPGLPLGCGCGAIAVGLIGALLVLLILPLMNGPRPDRRIPQIVVEISDLEASLAMFKGKFGMFPPSRITLHEQAVGWENDARSRTFIRRMWPQLDFTLDQDINGDGQLQDLELTGAECLVFFLGGVSENGGLSGFSKNPAQPLSIRGGNREGPFFEFDLRRLIDVDNDGFFEFVDPWPNQKTPYAYASSYDGRGYEPRDLEVYGPSNSRNLSDVYRQPGPEGKPFKESGYQIISSGPDGKYGRGGVFDPNDPDAYLNDPPEREDEKDNVTNFKHGLLAP